jgi:bacterioferritin
MDTAVAVKGQNNLVRQNFAKKKTKCCMLIVEKGESMEKQKLIDNLNEDLAGEFGAIIQYVTYAAKTTGPYRPQLSQFFLKEVADEQLHAQFLANKIVALGGEPTTKPRPVPEAKTNRAMLEAVLDAERQAAKDYTRRAIEAEELGDKGLAVQLEDMIRDETGHSEETERILRDWPI